MSARETPAGAVAGAPNVHGGAEDAASLSHAADVPPQLVAKADRALRAALREGLTGPDVEQLLDWVAQHRVQQRQRKARARLADVLAEIQHAEGVRG